MRHGRRYFLSEVVEKGACGEEGVEVLRGAARGLATDVSGVAKRRRITASPDIPALPQIEHSMSQVDWKARALEAESQLSVSRAETARLQAENADLKVEIERLKKHRDSLREMLMEK